MGVRDIQNRSQGQGDLRYTWGTGRFRICLGTGKSKICVGTKRSRTDQGAERPRTDLRDRDNQDMSVEGRAKTGQGNGDLGQS